MPSLNLYLYISDCGLLEGGVLLYIVLVNGGVQVLAGGVDGAGGGKDGL